MKNCKVLVVEDEVAIRDMLRMALEIADLRCIECDNILDAHAIIVGEDRVRNLPLLVDESRALEVVDQGRKLSGQPGEQRARR